MSTLLRALVATTVYLLTLVFAQLKIVKSINKNFECHLGGPDSLWMVLVSIFATQLAQNYEQTVC
jgi:hypothetical protein